MKSVFFLLRYTSKVFYIQICFKCETPLLLLQIHGLQKKALYRKKNSFFCCRLCKND